MVTVDSFIQARHYYAGRTKGVRLIVLHDMETDELLTDAEAVGNYFAGPTAPDASAHVGVDGDSTVGYVRPEDTAFGAPSANADGFHIEQAGRARQSRDEWLDPFSRATIWRAARAGVEAASQFWIPRRQLTVAEVADGVTKGFTDHRTVTAAFGTVGGHTDPGEFYPWDLFLGDMEAIASPHQEDEMGYGPAQCRDKTGRKWWFIVGDDLALWASVDGAPFYKLGGVFTSGLDATCEDDGLIVVGGRGMEGGTWTAKVYTDGGPPAPPSGPVVFAKIDGGHIYPAG